MGENRLTERELYESPLLVDLEEVAGEEAVADGCSLLCATGGGKSA